jgi:hypothetical protein
VKPRTRPRTCAECVFFVATSTPGWCRAFDITRKPTQIACMAPKAKKAEDGQTQAEWGST